MRATSAEAVSMARSSGYPRILGGRRALSSKSCETSRRLWAVVCYIHTVPLIRPA